MTKIDIYKWQVFKNFLVSSVYYQKEKVWHSNYCEPYEWDSEEKMRLDMLIHHTAENEKEELHYLMWGCKNEHEFLEKYDSYTRLLNKLEEDPTP